MPNNSSNTIKHVLQHASEQLSTFDSAKLDSEILLAYVLKKSRSYLYTYPEYVLNSEQLTRFITLINERQHGKPIAYLCGKQDFWSLSLTVSQDVLIPRPETEILVETILDKLKNDRVNVKAKKLIDLGTGSGCIALALAKELPDWQITAVDQSEAALSIAQLNAKDNHINNVQFIQSNWFEHIDHLTYDIIVSNPPYIAANDIELDSHVAKFEPKSALIANNNGLADYEMIIQSAPDFLHKDALLIFEIAYTQAEAVKKRLLPAFHNIEVVQDLQKHDRVISGLSKY